MNSEINKISFEDLGDCVQDLVGVMVGDVNEKWFKKHWGILEEANLTSYSNDLERTQVYINALTLAILWREFLCCLYDESCEITISDLVENFPVSKIRIGQLVGSEFDPESDTLDEDEEYSLYESILINLVSENRNRVIRILRKYYGDDTSFYQGFSIMPKEEVEAKDKIEEDLEEDEEWEDDVIDGDDELTGGSEESAINWISEDCPPILNY